jgi:hypothetical protein
MAQHDELHAELTAELRARYPQCISAAIVGSYAFGRPFVDDIDVAVFDESVPLGHEGQDRFQLGAWKIDVAIRNPAWLDPSVTLRGDMLFLLRELRKVVAAIVLFDDTGLLQQAIPCWSSFKIPLHLITPFYDRVSRLDLGSLAPRSQRLSLYYGIENMVLGWTHADMRYRYSKPKWLLWDLEQLGSEPFETLLRSISTELCEAADPGELVQRVRAVVPTHADIAFCKAMLHDTKFLVDRGERLAAVWPLRMSGYQLAKWKAGKMRGAYRDVRSIDPLLTELSRSDPALHDALSAVLLSEQPVPGRFIELFDAAYRDFGRCLERRREGCSS